MSKTTAFNHMKMRMRAGRHARRDGLRFSWMGGEENRRNTMSEMEQGGSRPDGPPLRQATTAPEQRTSSGDGAEFRPNSKEELTSEAEAQNGTSAFAATSSRNGDSEMRQRGRMSADQAPQAKDLDETASQKKKKALPPMGQQLKTIFASWVNILLIAIPAGFAVNYAGVDGRVVFAVNFIAIIPLAGLLGLATEEIALEFNETIGGLINATFGYVEHRSARPRVPRLCVR